MIRAFWQMLKIHTAAVVSTAIVVIIFVAFAGILVYDNINLASAADSAELHREKTRIYVTVKGEVSRPGVYEMESGHRVMDLLERAGGATENADLSSINGARRLEDEESLVIPQVKPVQEQTQTAPAADGEISLNRADSKILCQLPGVGEKTAQKIIEFREQNGGFRSVEQLKTNKLVNSKVYQDICDKVMVE